ncbi:MULTISPECIES: bacteriocin immunity protein [unclassified Thermoactinomyces]|uniref:bacteriocin immunity protein n=1 Tax=unclassified Thermoactinomyces TaxID=2634588 RepID=UPI0018DB26F5|nr:MULTISPECIES: bacteriocin immunity protein [unclassified Thermoactinomyces]MBH8605421.1 bacteriocin immunity protein [Thermoactinomyces sp. CICC 10522]MBH8609463.1 bacteriocin immunity protein [Thermoactinomyces sp. CICC 10521]
MADFIKSREELIEVVKKLMNAEYSEEEEEKVFDLLEKTVPDFKKMMRLIYWSDRELSPEEIVEESLHYQPIITPPSSDSNE